MSIPMNRRRFFSALGVGAAGAATWSMGARKAHAADGIPKRMIMISTGHGTVYDGWKMRPGGHTDRGDWAVDLAGLSVDDMSRALAPLHPYRSRLNVLDGLSMTTAELDISGYRHEKGWLHAWTGAWVHFTGSELSGTMPSLDQLVAQQVRRPDRLPSLELQVEEGRPVCHAGLAQQLPLEGDPRRAFDRVFGLSQSTDPLVRSQGSVLDHALGEFDALVGKLRSGDAARLSAHFDLVRQLEQRIQGLTTAECDTSGLDAYASTGEGYDAVYQSMCDIIATAFSCDFTRVATLSLGDLPSEDFGWGDYLSGDAHNDFAHRMNEDPQAALAMTDYTAKHAEQLAYLIGLLESIPDGQGGSLMDHVLIVWGGELGNGWHAYDRYCALTAGGGWHFTEGRYHHWEHGLTNADMLTADNTLVKSGLPHQHMLVSCAQAMGVDTNTVGMDRVRGQSGAEIDLTGGLPGL